MKIAPPKPLEMIDTLIGTPSVSSVNPALDQGNQAVIDRLAEWLEGLGFAIEVQPLPDQPGKANLVATLGRGEGGLVLSGHTDTVPCDPDLWASDPFRMTERDGRLYGLGTSDMKSFLALAIEAARQYRAKDLAQPLILLATADEESGMAGARALSELTAPLGRHAVIGEPTDLKPVRMHKGVLMESIRLSGCSGHSSNPALGVSALEGMRQVLNELVAWREELQAAHNNPAFKVPMPTLNLGHIHGGDNPNRICGECELHIDLRPLPGMDPDALRTTLRERLQTALADTELEIAFRSLCHGVPPLETPDTADIVRAAEDLTGQASTSVNFGTEGSYLNRLGMETVILGPGDIDLAHQPNEYLDLRYLDPTVAVLRRLIERFCVQPAA